MNLKISIHLIPIFLLLSTSCTVDKHQVEKPNYSLIERFGIDSTQLIYQYYQKFGFNEVCEDLRVISRLDKSPKFKKDLPISEKDIDVINNFSNKADSFNALKISFESNTRAQFQDIELDFVEFSSDSSISLLLKKGEYEIIKNEIESLLKVYDSESKLLYIEVHKCDGN